jgi:hypothetical protein
MQQATDVNGQPLEPGDEVMLRGKISRLIWEFSQSEILATLQIGEKTIVVDSKQLEKVK